MSHKTAKAERKAEKLKAWKIDLRPYKISVPDIDENGIVRTSKGRQLFIEDDFDVKGSIAAILFNEDLNLKVDAAFEAHDLAEKIKSSNSYVLLDSREIEIVRKAYNSIIVRNESWIPFLKRIRDAEEVNLKEELES